MKALKLTHPKINCKEPFKGLFTQGMVCHETYKDSNGNWLSPEEIEFDDNKNPCTKIQRKNKSCPPEAMSKLKKM